MNTRPDVSIILVTKNRVALFERSLKSILQEVENDLPTAEVVVIDGGSTDGTVDVIRRYADRLGHWVSEEDGGVAFAANKGVAHAKADLIRFIGDDDEFLPGRLRVMVEAAQRLPEFGVIGGHNEVYLEEADGMLRHSPQPRFRGEVTRRDMYRWGVKHGILVPECCYIRKEAFEKAGGYDTTIKWWGFLDLFLRMIRADVRFFVVPILIMKTYQHPLSDTRSLHTNDRFWAEYRRVLLKNLPPTALAGRFLDTVDSPAGLARQCTRHLKRLFRREG